MKRSLFLSFALALAASAAVAVSHVDQAGRLVLHATSSACRAIGGWALQLVLAPVALAQPRAGQLPAPPVVQLVAARAYLLRWLRRQVPLVQTRWRMCPSV